MKFSYQGFDDRFHNRAGLVDFGVILSLPASPGREVLMLHGVIVRCTSLYCAPVHWKRMVYCSVESGWYSNCIVTCMAVLECIGRDGFSLP